MEKYIYIFVVTIVFITTIYCMSLVIKKVNSASQEYAKYLIEQGM